MKLNGKSRSNTVQKPISIKKLAGPVLVLLAAVGIGMVIREFRFRSSGEKHVAQAPKAVQPADLPEIQNIQEQLPIEEVFVEPEPLAPEPVSPPTSMADASEAVVQEEMAAEPVEEDPRSKAKRARAALALIGYDPAADAVYIQLINDPSVSANDRHDLIEDLNEDGFPDPDNPTLDDLPMIEYRIDLIDDHAPYAMDKTNADAFKEARKDLVNMANRLTR
jgi:hypothetical protein